MKHITLNGPELGLTAVLLLASLGQFGRFSTVVGLISWHEIGLLIFLVWSLVSLFKQRLRVTRALRQNVGLILALVTFLLWTGFSSGLNAVWQADLSRLVVGLAYLGRLTLYVIFALVLSQLPLRFKVVAKLLMSWLLLMAALGIWQYLLLPDTRHFALLGWDDHFNRAFGTLLDPGFYGLLMAIGALITIPAWLADRRGSTGLLWPTIFGIFLLGLTLSFSRASYLAFIVGILVLSWLVRQRRLLLFIPLLIMALVFVPKDGGGEGQKLARTSSIEARSEVVQYHTQALTPKEMILGRGWYYRATEVDSNAKMVDNAFLHVWLSTGAIGLTLFLWVSWEIIRRSSAEVIAIITAVGVHSLFSSGLFYSWVMLALGLVMSIYKKRPVVTTDR